MNRYEILPEVSILEAMSIMDDVRCFSLCIRGGDALISIEEIQQALLSGVSPRATVGSIVGRDWDVWAANGHNYDLPVVIMAGGQGTRLHPLTLETPKPLIPIGDTTLIEMCMDTFSRAGCRKFFISLNYKADMIERYLRSRDGVRSYEFYREDKPLGSGGSLSLIRDRISETFIVASCDIILRQDFQRVIDYHRKSGNEATIVSAFKRYKLTYGNLLTDEKQRLTAMEEKPEYCFRTNTAVYVFEPNLLADVPDGTYYPITSLIDKVIKRGGRVGCFPITYGSWRDVGTWEDYEFMKAGGLRDN